MEMGLLDSDAFRTVDGEVAELMKDAAEAAEAAPLPEVQDVLTDVYVSYGEGAKNDA